MGRFLPRFMRTWDWLPFEWMHSLDPMDVGCMWILKYCCICCPGFYAKLKTEPGLLDDQVENGDVITKQPRSSVQLEGMVGERQLSQDNAALDISDEREVN